MMSPKPKGIQITLKTTQKCAQTDLANCNPSLHRKNLSSVGIKRKGFDQFYSLSISGTRFCLAPSFPSRVIEYILFFIKWGGHTMPARPGVYIIELWLGCKLHYPHTCSGRQRVASNRRWLLAECVLFSFVRIYESFDVFYFIKTPLSVVFFQRTETTAWRKKAKRPLF